MFWFFRESGAEFLYVVQGFISDTSTRIPRQFLRMCC